MANISSGADSTLLTVDPTSKAARETPYDTRGNALPQVSGSALPTGGVAGVAIGGESDNMFRVLRIDRAGNIRNGFERLLFRDSAEVGAVSGTPIAPNLNQWSTSVSGFAVGLPTSAGNQLTATTVTTAGAYSIATSLRHFQKLQKQPLMYRRRGRNVVYTNTCAEFGFGVPSGVVAIIPNSAHWRFGANGTVRPVVTYNSTEVVGTDISGSLISSNYYSWDIIVDDDNVTFVCQDVSTGLSISEQSIQIGPSAAKIWGVTRLPVFERVYNATAPATAPLVLFSDIYVCAMDIVTNTPWSQQLAGATQGSAEVYPGAFVAANSQNANYVNSTVPTSGTLSNTAASYTTLGGQYQFAAVAGAETDYALFGFTVPVGFTFYLTGIHISSINTGAAVATTPTVLQWSVANNSSAVSLATVGLTRTTVGIQSFVVGSAIGAIAADLDTDFSSAPLRTDGNRILHVILKMPLGTATASQIIRGVVQIRGYFE